MRKQTAFQSFSSITHDHWHMTRSRFRMFPHIAESQNNTGCTKLKTSPGETYDDEKYDARSDMTPNDLMLMCNVHMGYRF